MNIISFQNPTHTHTYIYIHKYPNSLRSWNYCTCVCYLTHAKNVQMIKWRELATKRQQLMPNPSDLQFDPFYMVKQSHWITPSSLTFLKFLKLHMSIQISDTPSCHIMNLYSVRVNSPSHLYHSFNHQTPLLFTPPKHPKPYPSRLS